MSTINFLRDDAYTLVYLFIYYQTAYFGKKPFYNISSIDHLKTVSELETTMSWKTL